MNEHHKSTHDLEIERSQVEAAKADPAKFNVLYEKYYKPIFVFIYRRTHDEDLTADLTANTFLKGMLSLKKFEWKGVPFSALLFRIALNEINLHFRKTNRQQVVSLDSTNLGAMIAEAGEKDSEDTRKLLMLALGKLNREELHFIELRFFEKRAFAEVGQILNMTENNAKVRTYRILEKLKTILIRAGGR